MTLPPFTAETGMAAMAEWFEKQKALFEALTPKPAPQPEAKTKKQKAKPADLLDSYRDFWASFAKIMPVQKGAADGGALEALVDPTARGRNAMAPSGVFTPFSGAPTFATLFDWDQKSVKVYNAWIALQQAIAAQRQLVDSAWAEAAIRFQEAVSRQRDDKNPAITSWSAGLNLWLSILNNRLLEMQRGEEFMNTQERLLAASLDYRLKLREVAEDLCELFQIPGRGEVDQLAKTVQELRRDMRRVSKELKAMSKKKEG